MGTGAPGQVGAKGPNGAPGNRGAAGAQGRSGNNGQDGPAGARGVRGMPGATGARGGMGSDAGQEEFVRQKVRAILDKLLYKEEAGRGARNEYFCQCKAFHLYDVVVAGLNF